MTVRRFSNVTGTVPVTQVLEGNAKVVTDGNETSLQVGELMQVDGQESLQVINSGEDVLRLFVTISPTGAEAFATDADV